RWLTTITSDNKKPVIGTVEHNCLAPLKPPDWPWITQRPGFTYGFVTPTSPVPLPKTHGNRSIDLPKPASSLAPGCFIHRQAMGTLGCRLRLLMTPLLKPGLGWPRAYSYSMWP